METYLYEVTSGDFRRPGALKKGTLRLKVRPMIGESVTLPDDDKKYTIVDIRHTADSDTALHITLQEEILSGVVLAGRGGGIVR